MSNPRNGSCLCGAITITASPATRVGACHCGMCRRWGGPLMAVDCGTDVGIAGEDQLRTYDSSPWAERGFCGRCGSHIFYRLKQSGQYMLSAGLFGAGEGFELDHQVFIDEKPPWYGFENETENMTGAEIFAKYGGG